MTMTETELKALLAAEQADARAGLSVLAQERADALDYYLGEMRDMPSPEGRSRAVSTDVADTVEGLMPQLMEIFCAGDEVVRFAPVGPEDVKAAEQETDYVNHVFMQKNPGFLVLYSFIKDALLSKTGIVKVWTEEAENAARETYLDQPADAFALIAANPALEIVAHTEHDGLHDVTVVARKTCKLTRVEGVPPEEFGIARNARALQGAGYCFHEVPRSEADLISQNYDPAHIKGLPSFSREGIEARARDGVDEGAPGETPNAANRLIRITEHYLRVDYEGTGKPGLYRVTTAGEEILRRDGRPDVVPVNRMPFAAMTPVIMTHRFHGRSIADLVMDIQRIKTALLRGLLDNTYLAVNPRPEIAESHASETTLDDLLVSRPGAPIRTRSPGGLSWQQMPFVGGALLPVMQFVDAMREWRTGVTRQGQGLDPNALQNQVATIANQMHDAAQAKVKLIARIFAETGIRDLFALLHAEIREHGEKAATVRLRNDWVTVDPRQWKARDDMTIEVGLGGGTRSQQLAHLMSIIGLQRQALAGGLTQLVTPKNLYNAAREAVKLVGLKGADLFFTDPSAPADPANPPLAPAPDPRLAEMQRRAEIEKLQAEADIATQERKSAAEIALAEKKFALEREMKLLEASLARAQQQQELALRAARAAPGGGEGAGAGDLAPLMLLLVEQLKAAAAPKRVVRDAQGRVSHVEPMV